MNNKISSVCSQDADSLDLTAAVEQFVAKGGVIDKVSSDRGSAPSADGGLRKSEEDQAEDEKHGKIELLKALVAKGAGINALQYSLRMNKKDIKQLATECGVKIAFSRPIDEACRALRPEASDVDDTVAGHAMHYSSLGYTAHEIAKILDLSLREVWNIGKAYRFEFKTNDSDSAP